MKPSCRFLALLLTLGTLPLLLANCQQTSSSSPNSPYLRLFTAINGTALTSVLCRRTNDNHLVTLNPVTNDEYTIGSITNGTVAISVARQSGVTLTTPFTADLNSIPAGGLTITATGTMATNSTGGGTFSRTDGVNGTWRTEMRLLIPTTYHGLWIFTAPLPDVDPFTGIEALVAKDGELFSPNFTVSGCVDENGLIDFTIMNRVDANNAALPDAHFRGRLRADLTGAGSWGIPTDSITLPWAAVESSQYF